MKLKSEHYPRGIEVVVGPYILNQQGQVLLVKSPKWQKWVICGGHVEPGESLEQAVIRETQEELGISIKVLDLLRFKEEIVSPPAFKRQAHFIFFDYIAIPLTQDFLLNEEIAEYQWVGIGEALQKMDIEASCREGLHLLQNWLNQPQKTTAMR